MAVEVTDDSGHREESEGIHVREWERQKRLISCLQRNWSYIVGFNQPLAKNTYF